MTRQELENKVAEIRKYKAMVEEATNIQKALDTLQMKKSKKLFKMLMIQKYVI